jgi:hypothetical protein
MTGELALARDDRGALRAAIAALQLEIEPPVFAPDGNADLSLLRLLYAVGRVDLPLGRLFEGHVDGQQIIGRYGSPTLRCEAASLARRGAAFGVWNADLAGEPLRLRNGELTGRADDPHQAGRLADLFGCADLAAAAVRTAAAIWSVGPDPVRLAQVAAARLQVAGLAESAMSIAQQAVGLQGLFLAHPLLAALTDLTVYLRQPAPDAQRMRVGRAVSEGRLKPAL